MTVVGTGGDNNILIAYHPSETSGSCLSRTWTARLTDKDANHYTISPPLVILVVMVCSQEWSERSLVEMTPLILKSTV